MNSIEFESWLKGTNRRPLIMGALNATPDSFSDGGKFGTVESAAAFAEAMAASGADWIDVGGESTRPGAQPIDPREQIRRTLPVIAAIRQRLSILISIDTTQGQVAEAALDIGANIVNDISAGRDDPNMLRLCGRRGAPMVLMHMRGTPATMQENPMYADVTGEVGGFLRERFAAAVSAGIERHRVLLDPGLGFGKTVSHNLRLLHDTRTLAAIGQPLVVGPSRKGFIGAVTGESRPDQRIFGTAAAVAWCIANGASVMRVHDVGAMSQVAKTISAISASKDADFVKE
ncbi:MAG: dihydropteroate synthase [Planctomycetota bacterium]|nr:dihydropteroate synthase [Planctomycetota bacterium]